MIFRRLDGRKADEDEDEDDWFSLFFPTPPPSSNVTIDVDESGRLVKWDEALVDLAPGKGLLASVSFSPVAPERGPNSTVLVLWAKVRVDRDS